MTTPEQFIDIRATMGTTDAAALAVRNALLALLRSWEDMHNLPRSVPTRVERGLERGGRSEFAPPHHNRGWDKE